MSALHYDFDDTQDSSFSEVKDTDARTFSEHLKKCVTCKEYKLSSEFCKGQLYRCKVCTNASVSKSYRTVEGSREKHTAYMRNWRANRASDVEAREKEAAKRLEYSRKNRPKLNAYQQEYRKRIKEKDKPASADSLESKQSL